MALRRVRQGEAIRCGMAGVLEMQRLRRIGVDPHRALRGHVSDLSGIAFKSDDQLKFSFPAESTSKITAFATNGRSYTLDASKTPKHVDLTITSGSDAESMKFEGKTSKGLYELDGDWAKASSLFTGLLAGRGGENLDYLAYYVRALLRHGEDPAADGTIRARENVIHEIGLFQGRLGMRRAIVMLEERCTSFSNIHGLTTIPFPTGDIVAASEEVRRVLEREEIVKP